MAKYETTIQADFNRFLAYLHEGILQGSISASFEDGSDYQDDEYRLAVRVYERYSMIGENRVSLSLSLAGKGDQVFLSAITSGGSKAVLFKINTFGEEAFLDRLYTLVKNYHP